jgi:hypothetical protein
MAAGDPLAADRAAGHRTGRRLRRSSVRGLRRVARMAGRAALPVDPGTGRPDQPAGADRGSRSGGRAGARIARAGQGHPGSRSRNDRDEIRRTLARRTLARRTLARRTADDPLPGRPRSDPGRGDPGRGDRGPDDPGQNGRRRADRNRDDRSRAGRPARAGSLGRDGRDAGLRAADPRYGCLRCAGRRTRSRPGGARRGARRQDAERHLGTLRTTAETIRRPVAADRA